MAVSFVPSSLDYFTGVRIFLFAVGIVNKADVFYDVEIEQRATFLYAEKKKTRADVQGNNRVSHTSPKGCGSHIKWMREAYPARL